MNQLEIAVNQVTDPMPATRHLGIKLVSAEHGIVVYEMECRRELTVEGTIVQGGIVAVLADYAAVSAAFTGSDLGPGWTVMTLGCETHNLRPAKGTRLLARGEIVKPGRNHIVAKADVFMDELDGPLALTGLFTAAAFDVRVKNE